MFTTARRQGNAIAASSLSTPVSPLKDVTNVIETDVPYDASTKKVREVKEEPIKAVNHSKRPERLGKIRSKEGHCFYLFSKPNKDIHNGKELLKLAKQLLCGGNAYMQGLRLNLEGNAGDMRLAGEYDFYARDMFVWALVSETDYVAIYNFLIQARKADLRIFNITEETDHEIAAEMDELISEDNQQKTAHCR